MARDRKKPGKGGAQESGPIPYDPQQLSPRRSDEQDFPEQEREITPIEEAGYSKGSTEGLAERDED